MTRCPPRFLLPGVCLALSVVACGRSEKKAENGAESARYPIAGVIRRVDASRPEITLQHGAVPGFMEAMTMAFPVKADPRIVAGLRVGDRISATLVVQGDRYWLEGISGAAEARPPSQSVSPSQPAAPVVTPPPNRSVAVGDHIPDFSLTDQTGSVVRLSQLVGQPVAVTFLYTRCPIATACPLTTAKFSRLDALLREKGFGRLLTITVDPEHDTPQVLSEYAKKSGADPRRWTFLTGDPRDVADVASRFGVLYYPDHGQVVHSQAVAVVDPQGKLSAIYYGENWEPEHILRDMAKARNG